MPTNKIKADARFFDIIYEPEEDFYSSLETGPLLLRTFNCVRKALFSEKFIPERIIYSGNRTIVFWTDGDKTIVKCAEGQEFDEYSGFIAALAKKLYGSTSKVKRIISKAKDNIEKKSIKNEK